MRNVIFCCLLAVAASAANVGSGTEPRPVMKTMPTTRQTVESTQPASQPSAPSRSYRSRTSSGCLSGDCALARARAAQTVTRAEAMAELNEKYRQRELQRQEARNVARGRLSVNQNINAGR